MLVLCSGGLTGAALRDGVRQRLSGQHRAALVVTADPEYREENYHVPRCVGELDAMGLSVDIFDLDRQPAEALLEYDVVEFIGGNPFYLMSVIRRERCADVLRRLANEKVLIGWSAADFVFGPTLKLVHMYSPEMNFPGLTDLSALRLTDWEVLPHYRRFLTRFEAFEARCRAYEAENHVTVIRLNDGEGIVIDGQECVICREGRSPGESGDLR